MFLLFFLVLLVVLFIFEQVATTGLGEVTHIARLGRFVQSNGCDRSAVDDSVAVVAAAVVGCCR